MKKIFFFILILIVLIGIGKCAQQSRDLQSRNQSSNDSVRLAEKTRIDAEKRRIEKESSLGIWRTGFYVDEFGERTTEGYITTNNLIWGSFSNSATENSNLTVRFLISGPDDINFQMYEYAGDNPVKHSIENGYAVRVKQDTLAPVQLYASNYDDRLHFDKENSKKLNSMLLKGGTIKFSIVERSDYSESKYYFEIGDASGYNNALRQLAVNKVK